MSQPEQTPTTTAHRLILAAILLLAAALRFTGLGWGLRHSPDRDERVFVENAARMVGRGDLDHRFYEYPGLVFELLALPLWLRGDSFPPAPGAYVAARAAIAACSVASVFLLFLLGRRVASPRVGLAAAGLLAVCLLEVDVAHMVRPDVVLEMLVLVALLPLRPDALIRARGALLAGAALGLATGAKFTGVLLAPSWGFVWLTHAPRRAATLLLGVVAALGAFFCVTPYAVLHARAFFSQALVQFSYHYPDAATAPPSYAEMWLTYATVLLRAVGPAALGLLALPALWRDWRRLVPLALIPLAALALFASSPVKHDRFLVPSVGVSILLACIGLERLTPRAGFPAAVALAAALPLWSSLDYARAITRPSTWDRALDWMLEHAEPGALVLDGVPDLGLSSERFELLTPSGSDIDDPLLEQEAAVVVQDMAVADARTPLFRALPEGPGAGPPIWLYPARPRSLTVLPLARARLSASDAAGALGALYDGDLASVWGPPGPQQPGAWLQVELAEPVWLARIELVLGSRATRRAEGLQLLVSTDGISFVPQRTVAARAPVEIQPPPRSKSQVLLLEPLPVRALRLVQTGTSARRWEVAELLLAVAAPMR